MSQRTIRVVFCYSDVLGLSPIGPQALVRHCIVIDCEDGKQRYLLRKTNGYETRSNIKRI